MDIQKKLILMRGLPGSGKSTLAKKLAGADGVVYSTDDFFMVNGQYKYDSSKIVDYHRKNFQRTVQALKKQITTIVIDNTNIKLWQMRKYVQQAQKFGYKVEVKESDAPWAFNYKQCAKKNTHQVPEQTVKKMLDNYQTCNSIEDIKAATDKRKKKY